MEGMGLMFTDPLKLTTIMHERRWEFHDDRFVEYGPEDEPWAKPLGFGKEVEATVTFPRVILTELKYDGTMVLRAVSID